MGKLTDLVRLLADLKNAAEVLVAVIDSLEDMVGSIDNVTKEQKIKKGDYLKWIQWFQKHKNG